MSKHYNFFLQLSTLHDKKYYCYIPRKERKVVKQA